MPHLPVAAGALLRTLRRQRGMTLRDAARHARTSISSLSRKERGIDRLHREFILHIMEGYALNTWEAEQLFAAAQVVPDAGPHPDLGAVSDADLRTFLRDLLAQLPFPAAVLDEMACIQAWNQAMDDLWPAPGSVPPSPHLLDIFLRPEARAAIGPAWSGTLERVMRTFCMGTRHFARDPAFGELMTRLADRYGDDFRLPWEHVLAEVLDGGTLDGGVAVALPPLPTRAGSSLWAPNYLVLQAALDYPLPLTMLLYVPYGPDSARAYVADAGSDPAAGPLLQPVHFADELSGTAPAAPGQA